MFMLACTLALMSFYTSDDIKYSYVTYSVIPASVSDVVLWLLLFLSFKSDPKYLRYVLLILHERLIGVLFLFMMLHKMENEK